MTGAEYLSGQVLADLWREIDAAFDDELRQAGQPAQEFLKTRNKAWNLVGRVHFNLGSSQNLPERAR